MSSNQSYIVCLWKIIKEKSYTMPELIRIKKGKLVSFLIIKSIHKALKGT